MSARICMSLFLVLAGTMASDTPSAGEVIAYGNNVFGPYAVAVIGDAVTINGIQVSELATIQSAKPLSPIARRQRELWVEAQTIQNSLIERRASLDSILVAVQDSYRNATDVVDSIGPMVQNNIRVHWKGGRWEYLSVTDTPVPVSQPGQIAEETAAGYRMLLDQGYLLVFFNGPDCQIPPSAKVSAMAEINRARALTNPATKEIWKSKLFDWQAAEQLRVPLALEPYRR